MSIRKQLKMLEWQLRLQSISLGNRGRPAAITTEGTTLIEKKAFESVICGLVGKANDILITTDGLSHTVEAPVEIFIEEEDKGKLITVEVIDQNGKSTFLRLL